MKWLNILGLILQFFAFWFAAPELLGVDALKRFEKGLIGLMAKLPSLIIGFAAMLFGVVMAFYGISKGLQAAEGDSEDIIQTMIIILVTSFGAIAYFLFFYKRLERWLTRKMAKPLIDNLIVNNESRKSALVVGAVLFTLGFLMQLIVSILA